MKKVILFITALPILGLFSCSNDDQVNIDNKDNNEKVELAISTTKLATSTRTPIETLDDLGSIGIYLSTQDTKAKAVYTYNETLPATWTGPAEQGDKLFLANTEATLYVSAPSDVVPNYNDNTLPIELLDADDFIATAQKDYMYGTGVESTTSPGTYPLATASNIKNDISLVMHHALAKVSFTIYVDKTSYHGTGSIEKLILENTDQIFRTGTANLNLENGTIGDNTTTNALTYIKSGDDVIAIDAKDRAFETDPPSCTMLIAPLATGQDLADTNIKLTIDGSELTGILPTDNATNFEANKYYKYSITVQGAELKISEVTILDWEKVDGGNTDIS